jgi:hypothetical protein
LSSISASLVLLDEGLENRYTYKNMKTSAKTNIIKDERETRVSKDTAMYNIQNSIAFHSI